MVLPVTSSQKLVSTLVNKHKRDVLPVGSLALGLATCAFIKDGDRVVGEEKEEIEGICEAWKVFLTGGVQGIDLRVTLHQCALSLGLKGWVCNLEDGRVSILVQDSVKELVKLFQRHAFCCEVEQTPTTVSSLRTFIILNTPPEKILPTAFPSV